MIGIDLFAGAGGMSLGARKSGIDVQIVIEADKHAAATYSKNHSPKFGVFADDIRKFNKIELDNPNNLPIVVFGGPPCQGFSTSNQKTRNLENEKNWLFTEFLRVVEMYNPDWVVFENVKGILETEKGIFAEQMLDSLNQLNYKCTSTVLNAENFGIPQRRDRYFIVANRQNIKFEFPVGKKRKITVQEALIGLPELKNGANECFLPYPDTEQSSYSKKMRKSIKGNTCFNNLVSRNADFVVKRYKHIPQGGNWENIPEELMSNYADRTRCHTGIYHRLSANKPSVVIGNYRKNMLIHPLQDRGLSVREAARLQSFPDDFIFEGSIGFQQQQVGNAVPPLLAQELFKRILNS